MLENLLDLFEKLRKEGKVTGRLVTEPDLFFLNNHRRPDVAWLTKNQIYALANPESYEVPAFVIEVISTNDQNFNKVKKKMVNYRDASVRVVWHVFPNLRQVDVYAGEHLDQMTVCDGDKICSADPVLPGFAIPASAIFYLPEEK
jgi:Uma2 family endonuclease